MNNFTEYAQDLITCHKKALKHIPTEKSPQAIFMLLDGNSYQLAKNVTDLAVMNTIESFLMFGFVKSDLTFQEYGNLILNQCLDIMVKKSADYATSSNRYSNFEYAANKAGITPEQSILNLIGIKIARLEQLILFGKDPKNEPIIDSVMDGINYTIILGGYKRKLQ